MSPLIIILLTCLLAAVLYYAVLFILHRRRLQFYVDKIPGPPCLPIIGNTLLVMGTADQLWIALRRFSKEYYPIYRLWFTKYATINLFHPDDAEVLLSNNHNITKSMIYDLLHPWFGTGLLTSTGKKWHTRRKILTSAFHFNVLREFTDIFNTEGRRMVEDLQTQNKEIILDLTPFVTKYTLNTICETAMGTSLGNMEDAKDLFHQVYRKSVHDLTHLVVYRLQTPILHSDTLFYLSPWGRIQKKCLNVVRGFSKKLIGERIKYHQQTNDVHLEGLSETDLHNDISIFKASKKKLAMLDLLIKALKNDYITDDGVWEEVDTFMFEGHDTTSIGMCFNLLLLAEHPEIQKRAREEVDEIMKTTDGHMSIKELQQLSYLERCIKEGLRLYPSVPFISRKVTEDMQLKNYLVPTGSIVNLHIFDLHRDPNFWPDPDRYDPDRFLPDNIHGRHPYSYIPFSGGPRNCIGQKFAMLELKAMIGHLLHNFYFEPVDRTTNVCLQADVVLRPKHPIRMKFIPRQGL